MFEIHRPKTIVVVKEFRFIKKGGQSARSSLFPALKRRGPVKVKVINVWGKDETPLYRGAAHDPVLIEFLEKHADPGNREIYFRQGNISNAARGPYVEGFGAGDDMGRGREEAAFLA